MGKAKQKKKNKSRSLLEIGLYLWVISLGTVVITAVVYNPEPVSFPLNYIVMGFYIIGSAVLATGVLLE